MLKEKKLKRQVQKKVVPERKVKHPKSEEYIMKKNTGLKIIRAAFWVMLLFFFAKGLIITFRPDDSAVVQKTITDFEKEFQTYKSTDEEVNGFAENFAKEYLTYTEKEDSDYKVRIEPYVSNKLYNLSSNLTNLKGTTRAVYTKAYRKEQYSNNQYDVYVLADIAYEIEEIVEEKGNYQKELPLAVEEPSKIEEANEVEGAEKESTELVIKDTQVKDNVIGEKSEKVIIKTIYKTTTLKVPVSKTEAGYVIEDIPVFLSDSIKDETYNISEYKGTNVAENVTKEVTVSLKNFLTAYYEQDQSVIDYYLSKNADKKKFTSLKGRYVLEKIESVKCYQEVGENIITLVTFSIKDKINDVVLMQEMNFVIENDGSQHYVLDMDARVGNLNLKK